MDSTPDHPDASRPDGDVPEGGSASNADWSPVPDSAQDSPPPDDLTPSSAAPAGRVVIPWARPVQGPPQPTPASQPALNQTPDVRPSPSQAMHAWPAAPSAFEAPPAPPGTGMMPPGVGLARPATDLDPMLLRSMNRLVTLVDVGVVVMLAFAIDVVFTIWAFSVDGIRGDGMIDKDLIPMIIASRAGVLLLAIAVIARLRRQPWPSLGVTPRRLATNVGLGFALAGVILGSIFLISILVFFLAPRVHQSLSSNAENLTELVPRMNLWTLLAFSLIVGIYEEIVFRGFLMTRLRRLTGSWTWGVVISTLIFTSLHLDQNPAVLVVIAMLSVSFSLMTIWRRSIVPAIAAHWIFDFIQLMMLFQFRPGM